MASLSEVPAAPKQRPIMVKLQQLVNADPQGSGWDNAWKEGVTPWEAGNSQPPLRDLLISNPIDLPRKGRALVPGCGTGHDAVLIANTLGLDTLGIDISPTGIKAANDFVAASYKESPANVIFKELDFFSLKVQEHERFDLICDYTFFVAITPTLRPAWASQMNALVKPRGYLITLIYPIDSKTDTGPPYYVRPEHYTNVLGEGWHKVLDMVPLVSSETHVGRERLVVWRKRNGD